MRNAISTERARRVNTQEQQNRRRSNSNRRRLRFGPTLFNISTSNVRSEPRVPFYAGSRANEGTCSDFAWGFILGFIFPFPFVVMIMFCNTKRLAKMGLIIGFIAKVYFSVMAPSNYQHAA